MAQTEEQKAALSRQRGEAAAHISDSAKRQQYISEQGDLEAKGGGSASASDYARMSRNAQDTIATQGQNKDVGAKSPSYKHGTDYVPKTGPAILHKGEAVLNKHEAEQHRIYGHTAEALGGEQEKAKKVIKEIRTRRGHKGGYIHEHHHTVPEQHPMEEHVSPDQDAMVSHMMEHMGQPNPGEAEADAGQGGMPDAGAGGGAQPQAAAA